MSVPLQDLDRDLIAGPLTVIEKIPHQGRHDLVPQLRYGRTAGQGLRLELVGV